MIYEALRFAIEAHAGQIRKFDNTPYIKHPLAVMGMMTEITDDPELLSACLLHDTVEDCGDITLEVILERFGEVVASYVFYVSEKSLKTDGTRKVRKEIDRLHYSLGPKPSQNIKILDMIDNIPSMALYDPDFAKLYIEEKVNLLESLTKADSFVKNKVLNVIGKIKKILTNV